MDGQFERHNSRMDPRISGLCGSRCADVSGRDKTNAFYDYAVLAIGLIILCLMTIFDKFEER
jgi:hypothetical protein